METKLLGGRAGPPVRLLLTAAAILAVGASARFVAAGGGDGGSANGGEDEVAQFSAARLLIEHNATAGDTGFQAFVDGEPWRELVLRGPDGAAVFRAAPQGALQALGLTELFFETDEPSNEDVPIEELLETLPAGRYTYQGRLVDGQRVRGAAVLTHDIPAAPILVSPAEGATVDRDGLVVRWRAVTETLAGGPVKIVAYQLIVEEDAEPPFPHAFAARVLSVHVPASTTSVTVPREFLQERTAYKLEVLAIEESGNQTITEGTFETR